MNSMPSSWFWKVIGWDGVLPVLVALAPAFAILSFPGSHLAIVVSTLFVPMGAALIRASVGWNQIRGVWGLPVPWIRQIALAMAIVFLLLFEAAVGVLTCEKGPPPAAWLIPIGICPVYLSVVSFALYPGSTRNQDFSPDS